METLLPLLLDCASKGWIPLERVVQVSSENPARIYGLYPRKGSLQVGADADFVIVDLASSYHLKGEDLHSKHPITPYEGWRVQGKPLVTYLRGCRIAQEGKVLEAPIGRVLRPGYGEAECELS